MAMKNEAHRPITIATSNTLLNVQTTTTSQQLVMAEHHPEEVVNETEYEELLRQAIALSMGDNVQIRAEVSETSTVMDGERSTREYVELRMITSTSAAASTSNNTTSPTSGDPVKSINDTPTTIPMSNSKGMSIISLDECAVFDVGDVYRVRSRR